ncbi:MAG: FkbM family methyltransferase [Hyphomicrobiaceae bacterium]|nr:FkbM family methyltransferase [Hyphomicrobiaceae bacterium]
MTTSAPRAAGADLAAEFGTYAPRGLTALAICAIRALPWRWPARRLAALARLAISRGRQRFIDVEVHGNRMRLAVLGNACDRNALFLPRFQDPVLRAALARALPSGGTFVDVGANVGLFTVNAAALVGPTGRVLAIEPQPDIQARLTANIAANDFRHVALVACAVGDGEGTLTLHLGNNAGEASLNPGMAGASGKTINVAVRPLADIVRDAALDRIDALKIDVEGLEDRILAPFFATVDQSLWPRMIAIEYSPHAWATDIVAHMRDLGYRVADDSTMNWILVRD